MAKMQLAQEYIPDDEEKLIQKVVDQLKAKLIEDYSGKAMRRDVHVKMHGLVKAEFIVEPNLPPQLSVGIFKTPATFPAWIRFSNAEVSSGTDNSPGFRGMAIKLMGVAGEKLLEDEKDAPTQDFLLTSTSTFLSKDVRQFEHFLRSMSGGALQKIAFLLTQWRILAFLVKSLRKHANPLQLRYWSSTPYLFGTAGAVKYSAIPQVGMLDTIPKNPGDDLLRQAMIRQLDVGDARFDFAVQLQTDAATMPIEDPRREWPEACAPFIKVATIHIPKQQFDSAKQREFGENLSFTPWHSLPEHRPLGSINRARKVVYETMARFRHQQNRVAQFEPNSWDID